MQCHENEAKFGREWVQYILNIPQLKSLSPPGEFKRRCDSRRFDEFPIGASRLHRRLAHRPGGKVTKMMRSMMTTIMWSMMTTMMMRTTMITTMMMKTMITMMSSGLNEEASQCLEPQWKPTSPDPRAIFNICTWRSSRRWRWWSLKVIKDRSVASFVSLTKVLCRTRAVVTLTLPLGTAPTQLTFLKWPQGG